jgi:hypothetical protein
MRVGRSEEGSIQLWCRFNVSVSARAVMRWDKTLLEDEAGAASSSSLNGKEV